MTKLTKAYHRWRMRRLERLMAVQRVRCRMLEDAERLYHTSYFMDRHIKESCVFADLEYRHSWHWLKIASPEEVLEKSKKNC